MYAIGKLAKLSNTTVRTLRYYDQIGILKPSKTGDGGHRYYDENAVEKLHQIMTLKDMGFELDTIHDILTNFKEKTSKELLQMRLEMIQHEQEKLRSAEDRIRGILQLIEMESEEEMNWEAIFDTFLRSHLKSQQLQKRRHTIFTTEEQEAVNTLPKIGRDHEDVDKLVKMLKEMRLLLDKSPSSPEAQDLAGRWLNNVDIMFKGNRDLSEKAWEAYKEKGDTDTGFYEFDPEIIRFIDKAVDYYLNNKADRADE